MRAVILAAVLAASPAYADLVLNDPAGLRVVLQNSPCEIPSVVEVLSKRWPGTTPKRAVVDVRGQVVRACWVPDEDGDYAVMDENGGGGVLYSKAFRRTPEA